jgi:hypothetical protein
VEKVRMWREHGDVLGVVEGFTNEGILRLIGNPQDPFPRERQTFDRSRESPCQRRSDLRVEGISPGCHDNLHFVGGEVPPRSRGVAGEG